MKRLEVMSYLGQIKEAKAEWAKAQMKFNSDVAAIMTRLLHEAARNYMSPDEVAKSSGFTTKRVRDLMRSAGLNPRDGKNLLSKKASEALSNNATLLGVEPSEMDLMSPLAYLPMGEEMRKRLLAEQAQGVTEVSGNSLTEAEMNRLTNFLDFYNRGAESISGLVEEVQGIVDAHVAAAK